jgi:hypothetical protein
MVRYLAVLERQIRYRPKASAFSLWTAKWIAPVLAPLGSKIRG